jgi:O26-antigen biosynthesis N-acetyl-L-fucosamine transferase
MEDDADTFAGRFAEAEESLHIILLVDCYVPSPKSGARQMHELGVELLRRANDVTVITTSHHILRPVEISVEDGVRVLRVRTPQIKGASHAKRAVNEMRLSSIVRKGAWPFVGESPADLIVFYSPSIYWTSFVCTLKKAWRCPAYLILRDIFPEWAADLGVINRGLLYRLFRRHAIQQYNAADVIGVQSSGDVEYFRARYPRVRKPIEVLHNWAHSGDCRPFKGDYRDRLGLGGKVVFVYGGNLGLAQDVDNLLRLAAGMNDERFGFVFVGEGSESPRVVKAIQEMNLRNVRYLPAVGQFEFSAMISEFDVGLVSLDRRLTSHNIPGKIFSYFAAGIPVLASVNANSDLFELLEGNRAGICVANGEDAKFRVAASQLAENEALRRRLGANGRTLLAKNFSVEAAANQISERVSLNTHSFRSNSSIESCARAVV